MTIFLFTPSLRCLPTTSYEVMFFLFFFSSFPPQPLARSSLGKSQVKSLNLIIIYTVSAPPTATGVAFPTHTAGIRHSATLTSTLPVLEMKCLELEYISVYPRAAGARLEGLPGDVLSPLNQLPDPKQRLRGVYVSSGNTRKGKRT